MSYYFAYGVNIDPERLERRGRKGPPCGFTPLNLKKIGNAILPDYQLVFAGHSKTWKGSTASIVQTPDKHVVGVLYETTPMQEWSLDCFEHADERKRSGSAHSKIDVNVVCNGKQYKAYAYIVLDDTKTDISKSYLAALLRGYEKLKHEDLLRVFVKQQLNPKKNED